MVAGKQATRQFALSRSTPRICIHARGPVPHPIRPLGSTFPAKWEGAHAIASRNGLACMP